MNDENLILLAPEDMPITDAKKVKPKYNCLQEMLIELLNEYGLKDADVIRGTGIAWSTYSGWILADVSCQLADGNLFKLWVFLNKFKKIHLETLVYGVGEAEDLEKEINKGENGN